MINFIDTHIVIISIFIYIWFAKDCIKYKRILISKIDWLCYILHAIGMIIAFNGMSESGQPIFGNFIK